MPYGLYSLLLCAGLLGLLLVLVMRMGYSDGGIYDEDRNFTYSAKGTYGTSGWMDRKELKAVLELVPSLRGYRGILLGRLDGKAVCLPENSRLNSNIAVYGASGSMKTRSFCMNRILQGAARGESLILSDPKSELYEKAAGYLRDKGYTVRVFNLVDPAHSDSWNCLAEVEGQELMAQLFVDVIIRNTNSGGKSDHFWDSAEMNLLYILRGEMLRLASMLPEFDVVMAMQGAGEVTGPQLIAEIGDVRRFTHKGALVAFAGMDAPPFQSGTFDSKSRRISKRGSPHLRKTLFMVASTILQHSDPDNPIFQFIDKKRAEGKHFYVYMVAGAAKFLRVYYARVKAHLTALDSGANTTA